MGSGVVEAGVLPDCNKRVAVGVSVLAPIRIVGADVIVPARPELGKVARESVKRLAPLIAYPPLVLSVLACANAIMLGQLLERTLGNKPETLELYSFLTSCRGDAAYLRNLQSPLSS